ncbi:MAG: hypothetical protein IJQ32_08350 [Paludibacteraceae bacterium]|nr:hypothetical protein [Paludibacteraceae bacterium]
MKKFFLCTMASMVTVFAMAIGRNDGSTKANAKEFDWDKGVTHTGGTLWYRVDLAPLYEEENPSLTLYLTNPSNVVDDSVKVSMQATVAGQEESKDYTIAARQYKTYTANAKALITLRQKEIYLTLTTKAATPGGSTTIKLSAKVFEAADLDETCKDARTLKWGETAVQNPMYSAWWKVSLKPIKDVEGFDAQVTIKNTGSKTVNLKMGQSLDCPSSGMTKREYEIPAGESIVKKVPRDMIASVQPDELYFGVENVESQVSMLVEKVAQPIEYVIPEANKMPGVNLHVTDTLVPLPVGTTLYKISVADMDSMAKYEPEFTYRNVGSTPAKVTVQMSFTRPTKSTSDTEYDLAEGAEEIVVYKKNMLEGMDGVDSIYLLTTVTGTVNFYGRFKHVREGKACKTNIDFNWETGHTQEGRTTQWYAINVADARDRLKDIMVYVNNQGTASANLKASMAFSCPYIDLTEMSRTIAKNDTVSRRLGFSSYAMMSDTIWIGLETNQDIKFWADTVDAQKKAEVDTLCLKAVTFDWTQGVQQEANDTVWYLLKMDSVRELSKFPTVVVENMSSTADAVITAEMSLECPDSIENEQHSITIKAADTYSRKITRNMFENIVQDEIYLRVVSTQKISLRIRMNEEAEGSTCGSAIPFNWVSGNSQAADANLWYKVDLREVMKSTDDLRLTIENKDAGQCKGVGQLTFGCPDEEAPSTQSFTLNGKQTKTIFREHSSLQLLPDSAIYINLQGNTAMRISAERVAAGAFDPIYNSGLSFDTIYLDTKLYTDPTVATGWYIVPASELQALRTLNENEALTPKIYLANEGTSDYDVTIEAAFAFPITEKMITKKITVPANQEINHSLDYKLFSQILTAKVGDKNKFDSIVVRITIPAEAIGKVKFRSEYAKAYGGNRKEAAIPITLGNQFTQSPNTEIWYKIRTADWKKKDLYGKSLHIATKNAGKGNATINVVVNDGILSSEDMLMERGERTIKKGESRSHNVPAEAVYGLGNVELYIKVKTNDSLVISTSFGNYSAKAADPNQQKAKLVVPNVVYELPKDTDMWFQICMPYLHYLYKGENISNYIYSDSSALSYELEGNEEAKITITATFNDTLNYNIPERTRIVNKSKTERKGRRLLSDLLSEAISRYGRGNTLDITSFEDTYIDSMLHRFVTRDSVTLYYRVRSTRAMKFCLHMPQVTGDEYLNPTRFDWEHGYVNPAKRTDYVLVNIDSTRVPQGKDLKIHMLNWTNVPSKVEATIYKAEKEGAGDDFGTITRVIDGDTDTIKVIERQFLADMGWPNLMIKYYSDTTTHVWAEPTDPLKRDTVDTAIVAFVCPNTVYTTRYDGYASHMIGPKGWEEVIPYDSINKKEAKITTYMISFDVKPLQEPNLLSIDSLKNKPTIQRGATVDASAATTEIFNWLKTRQGDALVGDTLQPVAGPDSIKWEYSYDGTTFTDFPTPVLTSASIALRYRVLTECDSTLYSDTFINVIRDTLEKIDYCGPFTWEGVKYTTDTLDSAVYHLPPGGFDSIAYLKLTIKPVVLAKEVVNACDPTYVWPFNGKTYTATTTPTEYTDTIEATDGCYNVCTLNLTFVPIETSVSLSECNEYYWKEVDETYYNDTTVIKTLLTEDGKCDSTVTLTVKINHPTVRTLSIVSKYGDRLLMINRNEINDSKDMDIYLDLDKDQDSVKWYMEATPNDIYLTSGYYLTNPDGSQNGKYIQPGKTYYARILYRGGTTCGYKAETKHYTTGKAAAAPALVPSLARPGEDIRVINLNPDETTTIRIYTTEGLIQGTYTVHGEESFAIKAANEHGFYLVELKAESIKSTLRYIVK